MTRRRVVLGGAVVAALLGAFVFYYFEPHKLFLDDKVDETVPAGLEVIDPGPPVTTEPQTPSTDGAPVDSGTVPPSEPPAPAPQFVSLDHPTTGTVVVLVDADGNRVLRLENLQTDNGPDLKVYLSAAPADGSGDFDAVAVNLGDLKGNQGSQNYDIPAEVDLAAYQSVVIWCDRFDVAFGAAPLR